MANWYYYKENGDKVGPIKGRELKQLAAQGIITPETWIENDEKTTLQAGQAANLVFSETTYGMAAPPPPPRPQAPNPFTAPMPGADNPFTAPMPGVQVTPPRTPKPRTPINWGPIWKTFLCILLIAIAGCVAGELYTRSQLKEAAKKAINERIGGLPLEIIDVSFTPAKWINLLTDSASGEFAVKTRAKEGFYEHVDTKAGLDELGAVDNKAEFDRAVLKANGFPEPDRSELRSAMPTGNLENFRFFTVRVSAGKEDTRTDSVNLTKSGGSWQGNTSFRFPEESFTPVSKLINPDRLDDDKTKSAVTKIIQDRKDFIVKVDKTGAMLDEIKTLTADAIGEINKELEKRTLPLEVTSLPNFRPRNWTRDNFPLPVAENFTANARTTKKLYQAISVKEALKELGYVDNVINRIPETTFAQFKFYSSRLNDGKVALEGNIALNKGGGGWQANKVEVTAIKPPLENLVTESELSPDAKKLDEKKTEDDVWNRVALIWPRIEFNQFCKGTAYNGRFNEATIRVNFRANDQNATKVDGEIAFGFPNGRRGGYVRSFSVNVNTKERTEFPVTGVIDNGGLPSRNDFARDFGAANWQAAIPGIKAARFLLEDYTRIHIQFLEGRMRFVINPGGAPQPGLPQELDIAGFDLNRSTVPFLVRPNGGGPEPLPGPQPGPQPGPDPRPINFIKLDDAIRESDFAHVRDFVWYGTKVLRDQYYDKDKIYKNIDPLRVAEKEAARKERDDAWQRIETKRNEIAQKRFYSDYEYPNPGSNVVPGPPASFVMKIAPAIDFHGLKHEMVSLPVPEVSCSLAEKGLFNGVNLTVRGDNASIMALARNNNDYQVKVFFTNLRANSNYYGTPTASVENIVIFNVRNNVTPQPPGQARPQMGVPMGPPGGMGNPRGNR